MVFETLKSFFTKSPPVLPLNPQTPVVSSRNISQLQTGPHPRARAYDPELDLDRSPEELYDDTLQSLSSDESAAHPTPQHQSSRSPLPSRPQNSIQEQQFRETHELSASSQQPLPNESTSGNMSRKNRNNRGAFSPLDTLNDPPHFAPGVGPLKSQTHQNSTTFVRSESLQPGREKILDHQTRSLSTGPALGLSKPLAKRQKLDEQGTLLPRGTHPDAKAFTTPDDDYSSPSTVQHISSRGAKRASSDFGSVQSYRGVEATVKPSRNGNMRKTTPKAADRKPELPNAPDSDFEMCDMPSGAPEPHQDYVEMSYANKPVASERNGTLQISAGAMKEPANVEANEVDESALKVAEPSVGSREGPRKLEQSLRTEPPDVDMKIDESQSVNVSVKTSKTRSRDGKSSSRTLNRRDSHKSPPSDDEMDQTDELGKSPDAANMVSLADNAVPTVATKSSVQQASTKSSLNSIKPGDGFTKGEKKRDKIVEIASIVSRKRREKNGKETPSFEHLMAKRQGKLLDGFYNNPREVIGYSYIYKDANNFKVVNANDEVTVIDTEKLKEAKFSDDDGGVYVQLKGPRSQGVDCLLYLVFKLPEDHQWFFQKFMLVNNSSKVPIQIERKSSDWLESAYKNHVSGDRSTGADRSHAHTVTQSNEQVTRTRITRSGAGDSNLDYKHLESVADDDNKSRQHRKTGRQSAQNGGKNGRQLSPGDFLPSVNRFRPYTEAMKSVKHWKKPLQYPLGENGRQVATVELQEVEHLQPDEFLNDSLIWFGLRYMLEKYPESNRRVHCFNTYFYQTLTRSGKGRNIDFESVKRWTAKQGVDIFAYEYVIVPINHALHWYVAIICNVKEIELHPRNASGPIPPQINTVVPRSASPELEAHVNGLQPEACTTKTIDNDAKAMEASFPELSIDSGGASDDGFDGTEKQRKSTNAGLKECITSARKSSSVPPKHSTSTSPLSKKSQAIKIFNPKEPKIITLDSLDSAHPETVRYLKEYLKAEALDKLSADIKVPSGKTVQNIPMQTNYCDCGLYLIEYVQKFLENPDKFVELVLSGHMSLDYWPYTVAEELRDDFREIVFEEGCKQNGIGPSPVLVDFTAHKTMPKELFNGETQTLRDEDSARTCSSINDSKQSSGKTKAGLLMKNKFEAPGGDESSSQSELDIANNGHRTSSRQSYKQVIDDSRPVTRGKQL